MSKYSAIMDDPREMEKKREECIQACEPFRAMMREILSRMPHPGFKWDLETGEIEEMPVTPDWQRKIDIIKSEQQKFIHSYFPELVNP